MLLIGKKRHLQQINAKQVNFPPHHHKDPKIAGKLTAKAAYKEFKQPLLVITPSLHLECLNDLPGTFYTFIPTDKLCKIANSLHNHNCILKSTATLYDGKTLTQFQETTNCQLHYSPQRTLIETLHKNKIPIKNPEEKIINKFTSF